jgi:hypothetical protein
VRKLFRQKLNPKTAPGASHQQRMNMKTKIVMSGCALLFVASAWAQTPPPPPTVAPVLTPSVSQITPVPTPAFVTTPTATPNSNSFSLTVSPSGNIDEDIDNAIEKKIRKHFDFTSDSHHSHDDAAWLAVPIVFIVFLAIFGTPIIFLAVILYFSFSRNRAMHKTVRMMVEKGQPVPEALLNPPAPVRQRSDLRRGVIWTLVGFGLMVFFGACNDWEGGAWSLGMIPFLIGLGYLIFWRFDVRKDATSRPV